MGIQGIAYVRVSFFGIWLRAAVLLLVASAAFAAGETENSEADRERTVEIVREYGDATIENEDEREDFNEAVMDQLSRQIVDVQGLEIALRAFEADEDAAGDALAEAVVEFVERTDERIRRGEPAHRVAVETRDRTRAGVPE